jgi:Tfp pilus assembly protein PilO
VTYFIIISVFVVLIFLAFWLTFRQGKKQLSFSVASILTVLLVLTAATELGYLTSFLMIIMFAFLIIFVSYWTLINLHFKKAGRIVAVIFTVLALLPFLSLAFEDYFFFKSDARKMLKENQIELTEDFKIKSNRITGLNDLYQKFELQISSKDKEKIIEQITNSKYFQDSIKEEHNLQWETGFGLTKKVYKDYEKKDFVRRETYQKLQTGYKPDHDVITISKTDNILTFERINE